MPEFTPASLCVFCGARFGIDPATRETAVQLGTLLAQEDITLVYGGGGVGLMGLGLFMGGLMALLTKWLIDATVWYARLHYRVLKPALAPQYQV